MSLCARCWQPKKCCICLKHNVCLYTVFHLRAQQDPAGSVCLHCSAWCPSRSHHGAEGWVHLAAAGAATVSPPGSAAHGPSNTHGAWAPGHHLAPALLFHYSNECFCQNKQNKNIVALGAGKLFKWLQNSSTGHNPKQAKQLSVKTFVKLSHDTFDVLK